MRCRRGEGGPGAAVEALVRGGLPRVALTPKSETVSFGHLTACCKRTLRPCVAGPTGLEPATCGVTGRRSRVCREKIALPPVDKPRPVSNLRPFGGDLVSHLVRILCLTNSQGK